MSTESEDLAIREFQRDADDAKSAMASAAAHAEKSQQAYALAPSLKESDNYSRATQDWMIAKLSYDQAAAAIERLRRLRAE